MKKWLFSLFLMLFAVMMYIPTAQAAQTADDAFSRKEFQTLYSNGEFKPESTDITVDTKTREDGIIVSGKNSVLSSEKISMGTFDFGTDELQRIQLDALAEEGKKIKLMIYLDDAADPTTAITLLNQNVENSWTKQKNVNVDVSDLGITGKHEVKITVCQYNKDGSARDYGSAMALLRKIQFVKQTIPVVSINIDESLGTIEAMNADEDHNKKCYGDMTISVPEGFTDSYDTSYTGGTYDMEYIKGRGNSTWTHDKKPYKIKLEKSADLFGMGANKNWALVANAMDSTILHNKVTYGIGKDLDLTFNPQIVSVDVIMNGQYLGNYLLSENIRVDEQRVNIDSDTDFLLGAGFWGADEDSYQFETDLGMEFNVTSPDSSTDNYSEKTAEIKAYMQRVENALLRRKNPDTGKVEDPFDLIDLDSAASYYLIQEMSCNGDFFETGSTYCYKTSDGKLCWGPLWDFDIAWYIDVNSESEKDWTCQKKWFALMLSFPEFTEKVESYWNETLYPEMQSVVSDGGMIDQYKEELAYSAANNFTNVDYDEFDYNYKDCNVDEPTEDDIEKAPFMTTNDAQQKFIETTDQWKSNVKARVEWINENLDTIGVPDIEVTLKSEGKVYAKTTAYGGYYFKDTIKNPVSSDKNKVFDSWHYTVKDKELGIITNLFSIGEDSLFDCSVYKNGKYYVTLNANFEKKTSDKTVHFEKSTYRLALNRSNPTGYMIPCEALEEGYDDITWAVGDSKIISVKKYDDGFYVKPRAAGTTKITVTTKSGKKYSVTVQVIDNIDQTKIDKYAIDGFELSKSSMTLTCESQTNLTIKNIDPKDYLDIADKDGHGFEWYTTDDTVVTAKAGVITAQDVGTASVICRNTYTGFTQYCKVTVNPEKSYISKAKAGKKKITVKMSAKPIIKGGSAYQVAYRLKGSSKWHYKTTTKQSLVIKKLKSKKKYYVRARAYIKVDGKKYYGSWSTKKLVKVK